MCTRAASHQPQPLAGSIPTLVLGTAGAAVPAVQLGSFVVQTAPALRTVTTLHLRMQGKPGRSDDIANVWAALNQLMTVCPSLRFLRCSFGHFPPAFLRVLGHACPRLTTMEMRGSAGMQGFFDLQPSFLPSITKLVLHSDSRPVYDLEPNLPPHLARFGLHCNILPDLSNNPSISCLDMSACHASSVAWWPPDFPPGCMSGCALYEEDDWSRMPPKLQHISKQGLDCGPPTGLADGDTRLGSLLSLSFDSDGSMSLQALAQLVGAAPHLQAVTCKDGECGGQPFGITCELGPSTATNLALLRKLCDTSLLESAAFTFNEEDAEFASDSDSDSGSEEAARASKADIHAFPQMKGATRCNIQGLSPEDASGLLQAFPDLQHLDLAFQHLNGLVLQAMAGCPRLVTLELVGCRAWSPVGLFAVRKRLPALCSIVFRALDGPDTPDVKDFKEMLSGHGSAVEVTYNQAYDTSLTAV